MRISVLASVGIGILPGLVGCAGEAENPNKFGPLDTAGAAAYVDMAGEGSAAQGLGGATGDPPSSGGSDAVGPGSTGGTGSGSTGTTATGGTWGSGGASTTGGASGFAPDGSAGGSPASGGSGAGGATCGGFLQPACAAGGAGGASTCGGFLQPACATGGAGGDGSNGGSAGADQCANETCFDIFDCYLYFPNAAACKFTKCEGLICKP